VENEDRTIEQLVNELEQLRHRVAELERKEATLRGAEEAARESEERFRTVFNSVGDAILIHDFDGKVIEANQLVCKRLGYSLDEVLNMTLMDLNTPEQSRLTPERLEELQQTGYVRFETAHVTKDGRIIPCEIISRTIDYKGRGVIISTARNISVRKQREKALRESEEKYRALFDNAADMIAVIDAEGNFLDLNERFEKESGYSRQEMLGQNVFTSGIITESSVAETRHHLTELLQGKEIPIFEVDGVTKQGDIVSYELRAVPIEKEGKIVAVQAILRNMAERRRVEQERIQREKLEAVLEMAGAVCHEFNQPLQTISGFSELLMVDMKEDDPFYRYAKSIQDNVFRMAELTRKLLEIKGRYATKSYLNRRIVDIDETLKESDG
jgi:PAS domain S-box-containing protein